MGTKVKKDKKVEESVEVKLNLEEALAKSNSALAESNSALARALADYDNLVKRFRKEKEEVILRAAKNMVEDLLPVVDNLERAQNHLNDQGLKMALDGLRQVFEKYGVREISAKEGDKVDVQIHEVLDVTGGGEEGHIAQILSKGYCWEDGIIIRPAKIQVFGKGK